MEDLAVNGGWRLRPALLGLLGAFAGLLAHLILGNDTRFDLTAFEASALAFVTVAPALVGFTLDRARWLWSLIFALIGGLVAAALIYWSGPPGGWDSAGGWRVFSLFLAIAIAAPLFQAARDEGAARFPYARVHDHAWANIVLWCASWAFVGISFVLTILLGQLFHLIKIDLLYDLLQHYWFPRTLCGAAFGAGLGLLREHDRLVQMLQRVVVTVLAVLAPVLAVGLVLFLLALPFTGLDALWDATRATTPILLSCVVGALILANVVIGNSREEEARNPVLRYAAMALGPVMLPLAVIASIATRLRIAQHGFTPDRLWALTFVIIGIAFGLAYLVALVRGRLGWTRFVRPANLKLAFGLCAVALLLATPLISFNAISARDQVARLESGRVRPDQFDWRALAFDFGEAGKAALKRLTGSANAAIRAKAVEVAKAGNRWDVEAPSEFENRRTQVAANLRLLPQGAVLPPALRDAIAKGYACSGQSKCTLVLASASEALLFNDSCFDQLVADPKRPNAVFRCGGPSRYLLVDGAWQDNSGIVYRNLRDADLPALAQGYKDGKVEIRPVQRRQAFVGGVPVGDAFE